MSVHCIDLEHSKYKYLKRELLSIGISTNILSSYTIKGITYIDVEVSNTSKLVEEIEEKYCV